jgi:peptidoglycan hydrolase-like protein with peptidoglycan-binding domain
VPWKLRDDHPDCGGTAVVRADTGQLVKCHPDRAKAGAHLRALYANEPDAAATYQVEERHPECPVDKPYGVTGPDGKVRCHASRGEAQDFAVTLNYPDVDMTAAPGGVQVGATARRGVQFVPAGWDEDGDDYVDVTGAAWVEGEHPRGRHGKFAHVGELASKVSGLAVRQRTGFQGHDIDRTAGKGFRVRLKSGEVAHYETADHAAKAAWEGKHHAPGAPAHPQGPATTKEPAGPSRGTQVRVHSGKYAGETGEVTDRHANGLVSVRRGDGSTIMVRHENVTRHSKVTPARTPRPLTPPPSTRTPRPLTPPGPARTPRPLGKPGAAKHGKKVSVPGLPAGYSVHDNGRTDYMDRPVLELHHAAEGHVADLNPGEEEHQQHMPSGVRYGKIATTKGYTYALTHPEVKAHVKAQREQARQQGGYTGRLGAETESSLLAGRERTAKAAIKLHEDLLGRARAAQPPGGKPAGRSFEQVHSEYQNAQQNMQRLLNMRQAPGPAAIPSRRREIARLDAELRGMGARRTPGGTWEMPPKPGTPEHAAEQVHSEVVGVEEQLREQESSYTPRSLVQVREDQVRRDLAAGQARITVKPPSGSEITMSAATARFLLTGQMPKTLTTKLARAAAPDDLVDLGGGIALPAWLVRAAAAPAFGGNAERLREYWTHGEGGTLKVRWGTPGDFDRCVDHVAKFMANPQGYCADRHHEALGIWPSTHAKEIREGGGNITPKGSAVLGQAAWNPAVHPRGPGGQFGTGGTGATPTNQQPVGQGETGDRVRQLQERLNQLGFKLAVDGQFGPKTLAAVKAYQKANGLKVDGLVGPLTTGALRAKVQKGLAKGRATKTAKTAKKTTTRKSTTVKPSTTSKSTTVKPSTAAKPGTAKSTTSKSTTVKPSTAAKPKSATVKPGTKAIPASAAGKTLMTPGSHGAAVSAAQRKLNAAGIKIPVTGVYDAGTAAAVRAFQQSHTDAQGNPLKVDGVIGPKTWPALVYATTRGTHGKQTKFTHAAGEVAASHTWDPAKHPRDRRGQWAPSGPVRPMESDEVNRRVADHNRANRLYRRLDELPRPTGYKSGVARRKTLDGSRTVMLRHQEALSRAGIEPHHDVNGDITSITRHGAGGGIKPGDYVEHPYGRGQRSTSRVRRVEGDQVVVTRRGKNYTYPSSQVRVQAAAEAPAGALVPALVTIPGVDILAAGTWQLSTGRQTFTPGDLTAAIDAAACPAVGPPVIKIGHLDARFKPKPGQDGEPAIGKVANLRLNGGGTKIVGDLAGMPGWLGAITASAYPRRSVEGKYGFKCQIGHTHPFVLTGLALLGITPPGVGVLSSLDDLAALYGVTTAPVPAAPVAAAWRTEPADQEETVMPVTEEDVRRAYYANAGPPTSWWITELQMAPPQLIIADETDGRVYRVPYVIDGDAVTFGAADEIAEGYEGVAASRGHGPVIAYASAEDSRAVLEDDYEPDGGAEQVDGWDDGEVQAADDNVSSRPWSDFKESDYTPAQWHAACIVHLHDPGDLSDKGDCKLPIKEPGGTLNRNAVHAAAAALAGARTPLQASPEAKAKAKAALRTAYGTLGEEPPDSVAAADGDEPGTREGPGSVVEGAGQPFGGKKAPPFGKGATRTAPSSEPGKAPSEPGQPSSEAGPSSDAGAGTHPPFTGTHSHPHAAFGAQGSDQTHEHAHDHNGDGSHDHAHTQAAANAAASPQEGGDPETMSGFEFTDQQMAAIRRRLGKQDGEPVSTDELYAALDTPRAPVAAAALSDGAETVEVPQITEGTYLVDGNILKEYQERAVAGDRAVRAMHVGERDTILAAAVAEGKFPSFRKAHFEQLWDRDPDGTRKLVGSLASGLVPTVPVGSNGEFAIDADMPGDFEGQQAYKALFPEDFERGQQRRRGGR